MQVAPETERMFELMQEYRNISFTINNLDESRYDYALDRVYFENRLRVLDAQIEWDSSAYYAAEAIADQNLEYYPIYHARVIREAADKAQWQLDREAAAAADAKAAEEAEAQRAITRRKYEVRGSAYMLCVRTIKDPAKKMKAVQAALSCFVQWKKISPWSTEVQTLVKEAQEIVAATQAALDLDADYVFVQEPNVQEDWVLV